MRCKHFHDPAYAEEKEAASKGVQRGVNSIERGIECEEADEVRDAFDPRSIKDDDDVLHIAMDTMDELWLGEDAGEIASKTGRQGTTPVCNCCVQPNGMVHQKIEQTQVNRQHTGRVTATNAVQRQAGQDHAHAATQATSAAADKSNQVPCPNQDNVGDCTVAEGEDCEPEEHLEHVAAMQRRHSIVSAACSPRQLKDAGTAPLQVECECQNSLPDNNRAQCSGEKLLPDLVSDDTSSGEEDNDAEDKWSVLKPL